MRARIELLRSLPAWAGRVAAAHTIPREMRAEEGYRFDPERFRELRTPTLLLVGGDSPIFLRAGNDTLKEVLPNAQLVVMPGQQHAAMETGTQLFTTEVLRFLRA